VETGIYEVVVPTYNVERTIAETLDSLADQQLPPARILIADDETPDSSPEIAARYPRVEVMRFPHSGLSGVQNRALPHVRADFVAYVDGDDVWHPETGRLLLAALESTDAAAVSVDAEPFPEGERPALADPPPPVWSELAYEALVRRNWLRKSGTMYRTEAIRAIGGWREDFPITGDRDVALRLMESGRTIYTTRWRGIGLRVSPTSLHRDPEPTLTEQLRVAIPRFSDGLGGPAAARRHARTLWFRTLARAAHDRRDLRDVPTLTALGAEAPAGQRGLELLVRSPLRHGIAAGWRRWRAR
jgi:hypothetical protein